MTPKLKQYLKITAIFISGLAVGIVIMGYLSMRASKTFLEIFRANYSFEQLELAAEARKDGNKYTEYVYRNNAVDVMPIGKLKTIENMKTTWTFAFPFAAPILDRIGSVPDIEKGRKISYGIEVARLAEATENIGLKEEADKLWLKAAELTGEKDINRLRRLVAGLPKIEEDANKEN
jgi:hypothetical protein